MDPIKHKQLASVGWKTGSAAEFLELSEEEAAFVELKLALGDALRKHRRAAGLTQIALAKRLRSSQSRVAKMEASDPSVSIDLLFRGLLATGASGQEIVRAIAKASPKSAA